MTDPKIEALRHHIENNEHLMRICKSRTSCEGCRHFLPGNREHFGACARPDLQELSTEDGRTLLDALDEATKLVEELRDSIDARDYPRDID